MPSPSITIRIASSRDVGTIGQLMAAAFAADPIIGWLFETPGPRQRRLPGFFAHVTRREYLPFGVVHLAEIDGAAAGAALWMPPERPHPPALRQLMMIPGYLRTMGRRMAAGAALERGCGQTRPSAAHWYLGYFGTGPEHQGRGVGAALLRRQLGEADRERKPAYLESSNLANVPLYEHFGFAVHGTIQLPDDAPVLTPMWRPAVGTTAVGTTADGSTADGSTADGSTTG